MSSGRQHCDFPELALQGCGCGAVSWRRRRAPASICLVTPKIFILSYTLYLRTIQCSETSEGIIYRFTVLTPNHLLGEFPSTGCKLPEGERAALSGAPPQHGAQGHMHTAGMNERICWIFQSVQDKTGQMMN